MLVHPHTYRDVVNIHNLSDLEATVEKTQEVKSAPIVENSPVNNGRIKIIGFKNVTQHAGATSLIYMIKKQLEGLRSVVAIEIDKVDFLYFNEKEMISSTKNDVLKEMMRRNQYDIILVDLNDYEDLDICNEVYYLIEPSTIMINKMMRKNKHILDSLKKEKIVLNKCMLRSEDVATFEYETKLKVIEAIPCVDDRQSNIEAIKKFINKIHL